MELSNLINVSIITFVLAWARLLGLFMIAPVFSFNTILMRIRVFLAFAMTLCITPWLVDFQTKVTLNLIEIILLLLKEFMIGGVIGIFIAIIFASLRVSSQIFSIQIGLAIAEIFDAMTNENGSLWGFFFYLTGVLVFIELGGMHILLKSITESYQLLPIFNFLDQSENLLTKGVEYFTGMFLIALKIAFPIIAAGLIISVALGVMGKVAPQANVFIIGLPIQLGVGVIFILLSIPFIIELMNTIFSYSVQDVFAVLTGRGGGFVNAQIR